MEGASVSHEWLLWVLTLASALHVMDEHALGWQGWAVKTFGHRFGVQPTWADFWATNTALLTIGVTCAAVGWRAPWFALAFPAVCLINAVFFHVVPTVVQKRPNPGMFTAVLLYIPISIWIYVEADRDGVLSTSAIVWSTVIGAALMVFAIVILRLGKHFGYPDAPTT
jgi:hypothetical protein